jgi:hypothetical protein
MGLIQAIKEMNRRDEEEARNRRFTADLWREGQPEQWPVNQWGPPTPATEGEYQMNPFLGSLRGMVDPWTLEYSRNNPDAMAYLMQKAIPGAMESLQRQRELEAFANLGGDDGTGGGLGYTWNFGKEGLTGSFEAAKREAERRGWIDLARTNPYAKAIAQRRGWLNPDGMPARQPGVSTGPVGRNPAADSVLNDPNVSDIAKEEIIKEREKTRTVDTESSQQLARTIQDLLYQSNRMVDLPGWKGIFGQPYSTIWKTRLKAGTPEREAYEALERFRETTTPAAMRRVRELVAAGGASGRTGEKLIPILQGMETSIDTKGTPESANESIRDYQARLQAELSDTLANYKRKYGIDLPFTPAQEIPWARPAGRKPIGYVHVETVNGKKIKRRYLGGDMRLPFNYQDVNE